MAAEGYTPDASNGADGQGTGTDPRADGAAEKYGAGQRAGDETLVNAPGAWTPEKQAAAGRLRDYGTMNDPTANVDEARYANQRLGDYHAADESGPLPTDPVLGGDARIRAQTRQDWQQKLEQGFMGTPPMTPDQATEWLNQSEAQRRAMVLDHFEQQLQRSGMSPAGAAAATEAMSQGIVPQELVDIAGHTSKGLSGEEQGFTRYGEAVPTGNHWEPGVAFTPDDLAHLEKISKVAGGFGTALDLAVGLYEINNGVPPLEVASKIGAEWRARTPVAKSER